MNVEILPIEILIVLHLLHLLFLLIIENKSKKFNQKKKKKWEIFPIDDTPKQLRPTKLRTILCTVLSSFVGADWTTQRRLLEICITSR